MLRIEDVTVDEKTADALREIARLHDCSVAMAAETVLRRYAERTRQQIETAQRAAKNISKKYD